MKYCLKTYVDFIGVVKRVGPLTSITARTTGNEIPTKTLWVLDETASTLSSCVLFLYFHSIYNYFSLLFFRSYKDGMKLSLWYKEAQEYVITEGDVLAVTLKLP